MPDPAPRRMQPPSPDRAASRPRVRRRGGAVPAAALHASAPTTSAPRSRRRPRSRRTATGPSPAPADDVPRGEWWRMYGDPDLDALEAQVGANQSIAQAEASYRAALGAGRLGARRATSRWCRPTRRLRARATQHERRPQCDDERRDRGRHRRDQQRRLVRVDVAPASLGVSWEIDLWGRIRRQVESQRANADANASDLASIALSTQAAVASNYFQLRQLDTQKQLLDDTITAYQRTLDVTRNRYAGGVSARVDVAQAETQLKTTQVQAIDVGIARAQFEHAIALLLGKPASEFSIPVAHWKAFADKRAPAAPPAGVPSQLLERRPDIAAAERRVASANAQIGVAKAAYFPSLGLSAQGGYSGIGVSDLVSFADALLVARAVARADAVRRRAAARRRASRRSRSYDANVAAYRQTVLIGLRRGRGPARGAAHPRARGRARRQTRCASARESLALTINQYKAGHRSATSTSSPCRRRRSRTSATRCRSSAAAWSRA